MKKLITTVLLTCSISSSFGATIKQMLEHGASLSSYASPVISTFNPIAGVLVSSTGITIADRMMHNYEGLENDAVEVLAGSIGVEDSLSLTLFKEDLHINKDVIDAEFKANGIDLTVEELTDEEVAQLALASSI